MVLLGSTGSIGTNALEVARTFGIEVEVLVAGSRAQLLQSQIDAFSPRIVVVADESVARQIRHPDVRWGEAAICQAVRESRSELVVNALVGFLGLRPTLTAIECGKRLALANKESLVVAGRWIDPARITPIDSEHFGLWYLLSQRPVKRLVITASGGAFRDATKEQMEKATLADVLNHPNWSMGQKITIDSATMINKLFEILEARWLFQAQMAENARLDAIIETQSIIHALIDFIDGSTTAHLAHADMRLPIMYAINPKEAEGKPMLKSVDLTTIKRLEFRSIDVDRYPVWRLKETLVRNPESGVVVNAANEAAIGRFLAGEIGFLQISETILKAYDAFGERHIESVEAVFALDEEVRRYCKDLPLG